MNFSKQDNWNKVPVNVTQNLVWSKVKNNHQRIIYTAINTNGINLYIRMNDFPDEPLYTLIEMDEDIIHFNDWPENWIVK